MKMRQTDLEKLCTLAVNAAEVAGDHIQSRVGQHRETFTKESGGNTLASQVVTEVDLESQRLILEMLKESMDEFPLGLLTEESEDDSSRFEADAFWCIDPLDGTLPFVEGTPGYSVSIALVSRGGDPLIGVVRDPVEEVTYHACRDQGAFCNTLTMSATKLPGDRRTLTWLMDRSMKNLDDFSPVENAMNKLAAEMGCSDGIRIVDHAGAALNGCWVAEQAPAVYFKLPKPEKGGGSLWDFAASACVMSECGLPATDIFGRRLDLNRQGDTFMNKNGVLYASSGELAEAVVRINQEYGGF
jgi:3'-phosphoadenosine 5'-phosphosulfate (PAPS) 3'-phosphatase